MCIKKETLDIQGYSEMNDNVYNKMHHCIILTV